MLAIKSLRFDRIAFRDSTTRVHSPLTELGVFLRIS